jgi:predicted nucleotidyltransferase
LNRAHLAARHIEALADLRGEFLRRLADELGGWDVAPAFAALFGSAARGPMRLDSDIDLLIVRHDAVDADDPTWRDQLRQLGRNVTSWTGNDTRVLEFSVTERGVGLAAGEEVLLAVRDEGIVLHGPLTYLNAARRTSGGRRG